MPDFIDTHAHLYLNTFKEDRVEVIKEAQLKGVSRILMPNIDHTTIEDMLSLESAYPGTCYAMMGLHPCSVDAEFEKSLQLVEKWLSSRKFLAVGEIGIDLYWDKTFFEEQKEAFRIQTELAKKHLLPIVIHCRDSFEETISLVESLNDENLTGVFHCFTGSLKDAKRVIGQGFYLGVGGVSTFKNGGLDKVIPHLDLDHLILETDSPYLAPVPFRGKRNQPSYIPVIGARVAELTGQPLEKVAEITSKNAENLFRL